MKKGLRFVPGPDCVSAPFFAVEIESNRTFLLSLFSFTLFYHEQSITECADEHVRITAGISRFNFGMCRVEERKNSISSAHPLFSDASDAFQTPSPRTMQDEDNAARTTDHRAKKGENVLCSEIQNFNDCFSMRGKRLPSACLSKRKQRKMRAEGRKIIYNEMSGTDSLLTSHPITPITQRKRMVRRAFPCLTLIALFIVSSLTQQQQRIDEGKGGRVACVSKAVPFCCRSMIAVAAFRRMRSASLKG